MTPYNTGIQKNHKLLRYKPDQVPRFITKRWVEVHDQSGNVKDTYKLSKQIRFKTSVLRSDLCDFIHAYIVVKGMITVKGNDKVDRKKGF